MKKKQLVGNKFCQLKIGAANHQGSAYSVFQLVFLPNQQALNLIGS